MKLVFERDFFRAAKPCYWGGFAGASGKGVSSLGGWKEIMYQLYGDRMSI
jgi:hypothetical protein